MKTSNKFPCSLPKVEGAGSLYGVRVGVCPGVGPEGWLRCFAHRFAGIERWGHVQYPAFAPDTLFLLPALQKWQLGFFWSFCIFCLEFARTVHAQQLLVPYSFLLISIFLLWETLVQAQALQHCSKGSQVPACLTLMSLLLTPGSFYSLEAGQAQAL